MIATLYSDAQLRVAKQRVKIRPCYIRDVVRISTRVEPPNQAFQGLHKQEIAMDTAEVHSVTDATGVRGVTMKLGVQVIAVSDVDRSKRFYERLNWRLDDDVAPFDGLRIVQFTPPGSGTSITFGKGLRPR
jgi:hypothetical protein